MPFARRLQVTIVVGVVASVAALTGLTPVQDVAVTSRIHAATSISSSCSWVRARPKTIAQDESLALKVERHMSLADKLKMLDLDQHGHYENSTSPVPNLCIPALRLQDGPDGIANADTGVTQLPSSLATGATFDTSIARDYGNVLGTQAKDQGIGAVQGPNLGLARVPEAGRDYEDFGEDPMLAGAMGVAEIDGIQQQGVEAVAKHFAGYTQESDRLMLDQDIPVRTLEEVELAPFRDAVKQASVAAVMCAYGRINGVWTCEDPFLYATLRSWGFQGFVRSDLGSVDNPIEAFEAGLNMIKPAATNLLTEAVEDGSIPQSAIDNSVTAVLSQMFRFGLIQHPLRGHPDTDVQSSFDNEVALRDAEESTVLLKNEDQVLPLRRSMSSSIAVIGTDASTSPITAGGGSSNVRAPFISKPLQAIQAAFGHRTKVTYRSGVSSASPEPLFTAAITGTDQTPAGPPGPPYTGSLGVSAPVNVVPSSVATATTPGEGAGWASVTTEFDPPETGTYDLVEQGIGDTFLYLNGEEVLADSGIHRLASQDVAVQLQGGDRAQFTLRWYRVADFADPTVSIADETAAIAAAAQAAAAAETAVVFVGEQDSEELDESSLELPGDDDALVEAVAAANPRTIVVLNTGGAVLMPWRSSVRAILEAWYPGEEDGKAIAATLDGDVDPSGRLPVTFAASESQLPSSNPADYPGIDGTVEFEDGLDIGYRWFIAHGETPLYPFGFGLSYTSFRLGNPTQSYSRGRVTVTVPVHNIGSRSGAEVVEAYLAFPASAGEPPEQLVAFDRIELGPRQTRVATLVIARSQFEYWGAVGKFVTAMGNYRLSVGTSSVSLGRPMSVKVPTA